MEWQDQGILLLTRRHGEGAAIIEVLTEKHGRHAGLVRGGGARKSAALLQPGNMLALTWRARLEDQLGTFSVELKKSHSAVLLSERLKLYCFNALSAMLVRYLPEREPNSPVFCALIDLLLRFETNDNWQHRYCLLELEMLNSLGYGIDLTRCAVTGQQFDLTHVSPKSGCAVSREAAIGWEAKLLPFPAFLQQESLTEISPEEFRQSLKLSGYFFEKHVPIFPPKLPEARQRLVEIV
ncbi:MAG TPA: DNA repair protein RecO [Rhodobacteraceae bacterium]|nr:DNA repair protein RecO [Paracoccaceae bacterium]